MAVADQGSVAAVANFFSNDVSILDVDANVERLRIPFPGVGGSRGSPKNATMTSDGQRAVISSLAGNVIVAADVVTGALEPPIPVGRAPYGLATVPRGKTSPHEF